MGYPYTLTSPRFTLSADGDVIDEYSGEAVYAWFAWEPLTFTPDMFGRDTNTPHTAAPGASGKVRPPSPGGLGSRQPFRGTGMSEPAYTPGRWVCVPTDPSEGGEYYWIVGDRGDHNTEKEIGTVSGPQRGVQQANAHLIAAAPDLHDALREAIEYENEDTECLVGGADQERGEECPDRRCHDHGCMVARVNRWRAVLAKAEGRASNQQGTEEPHDHE